MSRVYSAMLFLFLATAGLRADVCALTIAVTSDKGEPLVGHVVVRDSSSHTVAETEINPSGEATICDLPFGMHTVEVQTPLCHSIVLDRVRFVYPEPLHYSFSLTTCGVKEGLGDACSVYFRVQTDDGKPIGGAALTINGYTGRTDMYGRLRALVPTKGATMTVEVNGIKKLQTAVSCEGRWYREQLIALPRVK